MGKESAKVLKTNRINKYVKSRCQVCVFQEELQVLEKDSNLKLSHNCDYVDFESRIKDRQREY